MGNSRKRAPRVPADRLRDVAQLAEEVANEFAGQGKQVDLHAALRENSITWSYGRYDDAFDGMLEHENGRFHVYCNLDRSSSQSSPRARFTLAHELGHFYIDEHRNELLSGRDLKHGSKCEYESRNPVEQEADHFASNLLMPEAPFRKSAKAYQSGLAGILSLAKSYGTSVTSTAIRYVSLGIMPGAVIKWSDKGERQWSWLSQAAREGRYWSTIDSIEDAPGDSPTAQALTEQLPVGERYFEAGTTASAWFRYVSSQSYKDILLMEQAIPLGQFGVLTLIYPLDGNFPHFE